MSQEMPYTYQIKTLFSSFTYNQRNGLTLPGSLHLRLSMDAQYGIAVRIKEVGRLGRKYKR